MKSLKELEEEELGPYTLEEAKKEILRLENVAALARDMAEASNILLTNLMFEIHSKNVLDVVSLVKAIKNASPRIEQANIRCAVEALTHLILLEFEKRTAYRHN